MYQTKVYDLKIKELELVKDERNNISNKTYTACLACLQCKACQACICVKCKMALNVEDKVKPDVVALFERVIQEEIAHRRISKN